METDCFRLATNSLQLCRFNFIVQFLHAVLAWQAVDAPELTPAFRTAPSPTNENILDVKLTEALIPTQLCCGD